MKNTQNNKPTAGSTVILTVLPPGMLDGLPLTDQRAILEIVGKPIRLAKYDEHGRAELEFIDRDAQVHFIYVEQKFIKQVE